MTSIVASGDFSPQRRNRLVSPTILLLSLIAQSPTDPADAIYHGGPVVTACDARATAEAFAVREGRVVAVGAKADVLAHAGPATRFVDLAGTTLVPGFIDPASHVADLALLWGAPDLESPAFGTARSVAQLVAALTKHAADAKLPPGTACVVFNYDPARLTERCDPTPAELAALGRPVFLLHTSGRRAVTGAGIVEGPAVEDALLQALPKRVGEPFDEVERLYASQGVTTARERTLLAPAAERLRAARHRFAIDVVPGTGGPTPIQPPGPLVMVHDAVNGPRRLDPLAALREVAGTIAVGGPADFVVLSANPLAVERTKLKDVRVLETIKGGVTVFRAAGETGRPHPYYCRCCSDPNPPRRGWADSLRRPVPKSGPRLPGPDGDPVPSGGRSRP